MMQSGYQPISWPSYDLADSTMNPFGNYSSGFDLHVGVDSMIPSPVSDMTSDSIAYLGIGDVYDAPSGVVCEFEDFAMDLEGLEAFLNGDESANNACDYSEISEGSFASQQTMTEAWSPSALSKSEESISMRVPVGTWSPSILPIGELEKDNLLGLRHLLKAYGQAADDEQKELMEVISRRIAEKSSPVGEALERLAFYLCKSPEDQSGILRCEASKHFEAAFLAFYQAFPYGRFAHFAANSALLEAVPDDAETIHIVDFDIGEGIQWPSVIEAVARTNKTLKLTSLTWEEESGRGAQTNWNFDDTKRRLHDHAGSFGVNLTVDSMNIANLVNELRKRKNDGHTNREWMVFNCMVGLPHMGRTTASRRVNDFFRVAQEYLADHADRFGQTGGIITFSDGNGFEELKNCSTFEDFFNHCLTRHHSILESMQSDFPPQLSESRIAMETLFVAPFISSLSWLHEWGETRNTTNAQLVQGLDRLRVSRESVAEAREMLKGKTSYEVKLGEQENEMVLEWNGHELVRFSTWEYRPKRWTNFLSRTCS